jgi:tetratricopeptide (TPR) repeat protein
MLRSATLVTAALAVGACSTFAPPPGAPSGPAPAPPAEVPQNRPADALPSSRPAPSSAATSLLAQGRAERAAGRYAAAAAAIERALSIEPNDASLWVELAEIKLDEGDSAQANAMARKALTLAAGDRDIERRAARLID